MKHSNFKRLAVVVLLLATLCMSAEAHDCMWLSPNPLTQNPLILNNTGHEVTDGTKFGNLASTPPLKAPEEKVAYAVLSTDKLTLSFYYDTNKDNREGTVYTTDQFRTWYSYDGWAEGYSYDNTPEITTVYIDSSFADYDELTTTASWFYGCEQLTTIEGLQYLNTANVTDMSGMFYNCSNLESVDMSHFNTSNVTDMSYMFSGCIAFEDIDVSHFNTVNVTNMNGLFSSCINLKGLDLTNFNTSNVTDMSDMFDGCVNLTSLDISSFDTRNVVSMDAMFSMCKSLTNLDVSHFNTSEVTSMTYMFGDCSLLTNLDLSAFDTKNVKNMGAMFMSCESLTSLNLSSFNTTNVLYMDFMFAYCVNLTGLDIGSFDTRNVENMSGMFYECEKLYHIDLSGFNTANVSFMGNMFSWCDNLTTITVSDLWTTEAVEESYGMFYECTNLKGGDGTLYDSDYTDKTKAYAGDGGYLTLKSREAYAVLSTDKQTLSFYFDTHKDNHEGAIYTVGQFRSEEWNGWAEGYSEESHPELRLVVIHPSFADYYGLTNTTNWFYNCDQLTAIEGLRYLNTGNVTNMSNMFTNCSSLSSLDLSHFDTSNVTDMNSMFYGCAGLTSINLGGFNTVQVTNMVRMFYDCNSMTTIFVTNLWTTAAVSASEEMFGNCLVLVGSDGTPYNENQTDKSKAYAGSGGYLSTIVKEAYAVLSSDKLTLSFYYDTFKDDREGTIYTTDQFRSRFSENGWAEGYSYSYGNRPEITTVYFDSSFAEYDELTSTASWFKYCDQLTVIEGLQHLNTCNVTDMSYMFSDCDNLKNIDVSNFDTRKVSNMSNMFNSCNRLTSLDLRNFNTQNVTDMSWMFSMCYNLTVLDLSSFITANVTQMYGMFSWCNSLKTIMVSDTWTTNAVISSVDMFYGCDDLVGGDGTTYDYRFTDKTKAHFGEGGYLTSKFSKKAYAVLSPDKLTLSFYYDINMDGQEGTVYDAEHFRTDIDNGWAKDCIFDNSLKITTVFFDSSFVDYDRLTSTASWFADCKQLTTIEGLQYLNTTNVTDMSSMFSQCSSLSDIDVSHFNTANVTNMSYMFSGCNLTNLDISSFNTAKVTDMNYMFSWANYLTTIIISDSWITESVTKSEGMFDDCFNLVGESGTIYDPEYVDKTKAYAGEGGYLTISLKEPYAVLSTDKLSLSFYYDTHKLVREGTIYTVDQFRTSLWNGWAEGYTDDSYPEITKVCVDPSFADYNGVTTTAYWFSNCNQLSTIEGLQYLNTGRVTNMEYMFSGCSKLYVIEVGDLWSTDNVTISEKMFDGCFNLVGGDGTAYDSEFTDKTKAYAGVGGYLSIYGEDDYNHFTYDNITYAVLTENTVTIDKLSTSLDNQLSIVIPETVNHHGREYVVTEASGEAFITAYGDILVLPSTIQKMGSENRISGFRSVYLQSPTPPEGGRFENVFIHRDKLNDYMVDNDFWNNGMYSYTVVDGMDGNLIYQLNYGEVSAMAWVDGNTSTRRIVVPATINHSDGETYPVTNLYSYFLNNHGFVGSIKLPASINSVSDYALPKTKIVVCAAETPPYFSASHQCLGDYNNETHSYLYREATLYVKVDSKNKYVNNWEWNDFGTIMTYDEEDGLLTYSEKEPDQLTVTGLMDKKQTEIEIPETVLTEDGRILPVMAIGQKAFAENTIIRSVQFPTTIHAIGEKAFYGCTGILSLSLPDNVGVIEDMAFAYTLIENYEVGNNPYFKVDSVFLDTYYGEDIEVEMLMSIDGKTLLRCAIDADDRERNAFLLSSSWSVPDGIEAIASGALTNIPFKGLYLPASVSEIGLQAFAATHIQNVELDEGNTSFYIDDGVLLTADTSRIVYFPRERYGYYTIPKKVTGLDAHILCSENFTGLTLHSGLYGIDKDAFRPSNFDRVGNYLTSIDTLFVLSERPIDIDGNTFDEQHYNNTVLYVPMGTAALYGSTAPWSMFTTITSEALCEGDYALLKAFYEEMGSGEGWNYEWQLGNSPAEARGLFGVQIRGEHVTALDLSNYGLKGKLSPQIFNLPLVSSVNLSGNRLDGSIDSLITVCDIYSGIVTELDISHNRFTGNLGAIVNAMPNLVTLKASSNKLSEVIPALPATITSIDLTRQSIEQEISYRDLIQGKNIPTIITYQHFNRNYQGGKTLTVYSQEQNPSFNVKLYKNGNVYKLANDKVYNLPNDNLLFATDSVTHSSMPVRMSFSPGDANLDFILNVADLQTIINYALGHHPHGVFNFTASDLQADRWINVQDVVAEVNLLLDQEIDTESGYNSRRMVDEGNQQSDAQIFWRGNELILCSTGNIAAIDLVVSSDGDVDWLIDENRFDVTACRKGNLTHLVMCSMQHNTFDAGEVVLARANGSNASVVSVAIADANANLLNASTTASLSTTISEVADNSNVKISFMNGNFIVRNAHDIKHLRWEVLSLGGQVLYAGETTDLTAGMHSMGSMNLKGGHHAIVRIIADGYIVTKNIIINN